MDNSSSGRAAVRMADVIAPLIRNINLLEKHKLVYRDPLFPGESFVGYPTTIENAESPNESIFPDDLFFEIVTAARTIIIDTPQLANNHGMAFSKIMSETLGLPPDEILTASLWYGNEDIDHQERMTIMSNTLEKIGALLRAIEPLVQNLEMPYKESTAMQVDPNAEFLTVEEAAHLARCSIKTIYNHVCNYKSENSGKDLPWIARKQSDGKRAYGYLIRQREFRLWLNGNPLSSAKRPRGRPRKAPSVE